MMGLSGWLHWVAWFIKYLLFLLIAVMLMTVLLTVRVSRYGSVIGHTSWSILFVFLFIYSIATINFCFLVSVLFSKGTQL